jgi:G:T/U-mismatch repair DNA glycosylase
VAATIGFSTATARTPMTSAVTTGAIRQRSAERPAARITTSSDVRAMPRNSTSVARITTSGRMRYRLPGTFSAASPAAWAKLTLSPEKRRICSTMSRSIRNSAKITSTEANAVTNLRAM